MLSFNVIDCCFTELYIYNASLNDNDIHKPMKCIHVFLVNVLDFLAPCL